MPLGRRGDPVFAPGEWPPGTDPALAARLFTAGLYGLMAQWHLALGSFSWESAVAALAGSPDCGAGDFGSYAAAERATVVAGEQ